MSIRTKTRNGFFNHRREAIRPMPPSRGILRDMLIEPLEGRIAPAAVITVTLNDDNSGPVIPGDTINYTEIISHGAGSDADAINLQIAHVINNANFVPGSLNISPLAFNDAFTAIGNTHLLVGSGPFGISTPAKTVVGNLFANDLEFANDLGVMDTFTLASYTQPAQSGSSVTVNPDGSFIYMPAAGFTGIDTFTYTITDDGVGGTGALSTTATVTITVGEVVWYVDDSAAPGGTGRSNSPLQSLVPLNNGGALDGLDNANDVIFVYSGSYNSPLTLETGQKLIGQPTGLTVDNVSLVASGGTRPTISGSGATATLTLASGNEVRGLNFTNTAGSGITGNNVGTLVLADFDVTVTGGTALNLTGSGTVTVTGNDNDLSATTGTALNVSNVTIGAAGMTFKSIAASGGTNGIVLQNTGSTAGLTVTGVGTTANSGGIIQNTTSDGIVLQNTKDASFNGIRLLNTGRHGIFGNDVDGFRLTNSAIVGAGDADEENGIQFGQDNAVLGTVTTVGVKGTVLIQDTLIDNATQWGLRVYNNSDSAVLNMTLQRLTVQNNVGTFGENAVSLRFEDGTANVLVDDSDFVNNDGGFSAQAIGFNGAVMNVTIQNSVFDENLSLPSAVNFTTGGNTTGRLKLNNNTLSGDDAGTGSSTLIDLDAADTSTLEAIITNNHGFDTGLGGALEFIVNDNATGRAEVRNNTFTLTGSNKIGMLFRARTVAPENNETGSLDLTLSGNTINNVNSSGGLAAGFQIDAGNSGSTPTHANTIRLNVSTASGAGGNVVNGTATDGLTYDFVVRQRLGTTFQLQGYTGSASDAGAIAAFFDTHNSTGSHNPAGTDTLVGTGGTHLVNYVNGIVQLPVAPTLPPAPLLLAPTEVPSPESITGEETDPGIIDDGLLSQAELDSLVAAAKAQWIASGLSAEQIALLDSITFEVADLGGRTLGLTSGTRVTLDNDGAGAGWFVDATPEEDSEFGTGALVSRLDALTAVMHEMGHVLGLEDTYDQADSGSVMYGFLTFDTRRAPVAGEAFGATPHEHTTTEYVLSPINTARNGAGVTVPITLPLGKTLTLNFAATVPTSTTATSVSTQATVTGTGINVVSNDPTTVAANDPTITPIDLPDIKVELLAGASLMEDGSGTLVYTFTRQGATDFARTINFSVGGSATFGADYTQSGAATFTTTGGTVTFAEGQSSVTVTLTPTADSTVESNETAVLTVTSGLGYDVGTPAAATGTIINDDTDVKVELLSGTTVAEDGTPNLVYTFTRTGVTTGTHTVNFSLSGSASLTSSDYAILSAAGITFNAATGIGTVTFNPGETTKTVTLDPTADNVVESDEVATLTVTPGTGYNVAGNPASGTIVNDDTDVKVELLSGTSVAEDGTPNLVYTFTRIGVTTAPLTVNFSLSGSASLTSSDYAILSTAGITFNAATGVGTVTFNSGETTKTVTLDPTADNVVEADEVATLTVTPGTGYNVIGSPASGTIVNDDTDVKVELLSGTTVAEDGTPNLVYTFTRTGVTTGTHTVNFSLTGSASLTSSDYAILTAAGITFNAATGVGTVTFNPGETTKTVTLDPTVDNMVEADEVATLTVTPGTGYNVTGSPASGTIVNDDTDVKVELLAGTSVAEDGGPNLVYTFTRTGLTTGTHTVNFSLSGSASLTSSDYAILSAAGITFNAATGVGTVTFNPGETTKTVTLDPAADNVVEADEVATLTVTPGTGYNVAGSPASGTITNDDANVTLTVSPGAVLEDGTEVLTYTFTRTGFTAGALRVDFTVDGTAKFSEGDFVVPGLGAQRGFDPGTGTGFVIFAAGDATATFTVDPTADTDAELDENVSLTLVPGTGHTPITTGSVTGTILNDDTIVTLSATPSTLGEGGSGTLVYTFTRTGDANAPATTVNFSLAGTATLGSDYTLTGASIVNGLGTVVIPQGSSSVTVTIAAINDAAVEGDETMALTVTAGAGYGVGTAAPVLGTITDNDFATVSLVSNTSSVGEGAGTHNVGVQLVITANGSGTPSLEREVKVNLADLLSGSATGAGSDYTFATPQTVTFASGATSSTQNVAVTLVNDARVEGNETIALQLGSLVDGTAGQVSLTGNANHTVTITDNDTATVSLVSNTSSVGEGAGTHNVGVQLVITANGTGTPSLEREVKVNLADLLSGSATGAGSDYTFATPQTVTFASGATASTQNVAVTLVNDARVEGNETIALQLGSLVDGTAGQVTLTGNANHTVTITDNDTATVSLVSNTSSVGEGAETHNVGVQLVITANGTGTPSLEREVKVNLADLLSGSATGAGSDYTFATPQTVTFASGATASTQNVAVTLVNDARVEGNETIALQLGSLMDGTAGQVTLTGNANHTVTITDNDTATVSLVSNTSSVGEGAGTHNVGVQLVITANGTGTPSLEREVKVNLADLLSGSASGAGSDYTFASPQTVTFASGSTASTQNVAVTLVNDARVEGNETIALQLGSLVDGTAGQVSLTGNANHTVTITDNDTATVSLVSNTSSVGEGAGTHNVGVQLVITADGTGTASLEREVSVTVADLLNGTATGADYSFASSQTVVFAAGETSSTKNVQLSITNDLFSEGNESINLQLNTLTHSAGSQITLASPTNHVVTIVDNDVDLRVTKSESVETVVAGSGAGNLTYTVTVKNLGLTNATGVIVAENLTLPAGVSILSITPSAGGFNVTTAPDGSWVVGDLAVGEEATLTVILTVGASAAEGVDVISNTASITAADQVIVNLVDDVASQSTSIDRQVDLQVTKDDGVTTVSPGDTIAYVINIKNVGPSDATGVVLTETLPAGTTFNAAASREGWIETSSGSGIFIFSLGTAPGNSEGAPVIFAVTVIHPAATGLHTVENTVSMTDDGTAGPDLNVTDNTATDLNLVDASPELSLTITDDISATVARGGLVRYTLTYANTGSQNADGVYLIENVPANATFDPFESDGNWVLQQDGTYRLDIGSLEAGTVPQSVIFAVRVNTSVPAEARELVNTALIDDNGDNSAVDLSVSSSERTLFYQGIYVVAPGIALPKKGAPATVRVFDVATGLEVSSFLAYENYKDSIRVAVGDFNGDGFDDIVTSTRLGSGQVRVFDGLTGERLPIGEQLQLDPFNGKKDKGAYIAVGDVTGDGWDDIVVGSALGGSKVKIYNGVTGELVNEYNAFAKSYRGGVRLAVGDVNGDGVDDVIAGQGNFGRTAKVFSDTSDTLIQQIQVGGKGYRGGISVAAGDVNGDGRADIITGRSGKSAPWVEIFSGEDRSSLGRFLAFEAKFRNGIRVATADVNVDGIADIIVGAGYKGGSRVSIFDGSGANGFAEIRNFVAFPDYRNVSLFVAGTSPVPIIQSQPQLPV